jgi:Mn2+/Fe2+ NRAMP family transporter
MSQPNERDTLPPSMDPAAAGETVEAPTDFFGILKRLGPGLIIAGSIVGSGELIATTKTGAQAGISLLWLIVIGCLIKVFVQVELGRFAITHGETTLSALNRVPGPRLRVNWIVWSWVVMVLCGIGQLGGIVGGVGQALAISFPLKGDYAYSVQMPSSGEMQRYLKWNDLLLSEWDVRLSAGWNHEVDRQAAFAENDDLPDLPGLSSDESRWIRHVVATTAAQLDEFETHVSGGKQQILSAAEKLLTAEQQLASSRKNGSGEPGALSTARQERDAARKSLQQLLDRANDLWIHGDSRGKFGDESLLNSLKERNEAQQRRVLNGHAILSSQLAELDAANRATEAVVATVRFLEAKAKVQEAEKHLENVQDSAGADAAEILTARKQVEIAEIRAGAEAGIVGTLVEPPTTDDKYWAAVVTIFTCVLLFRGRYGMIQNVSMALVVGFTFITVGNVIALQNSQEWHIPTSELARGMSFGLPLALDGAKPIITALATFGIIGVGASELIAYPYWCLEKGYARFTGPRTSDASWAHRARGWMRVMLVDTMASMVIYTVATLAFFLMGVAVLYNEGRDPDGMRMVSTLATAYVPVFGEYARWLFLIGAIAVLYSTFMVANAGNARMFTDALKVFGLMDRNSQTVHDKSITVFSVLLPIMCLAVFWTGANPVYLVLLAGTLQAVLLPMIGFGSLYFRYKLTDERLKPTPLWDFMLVVSVVGLLIAGAWGALSRFF